MNNIPRCSLYLIVYNIHRDMYSYLQYQKDKLVTRNDSYVEINIIRSS